MNYFDKLIKNVKAFKNEEIGLVECLENHSKICYNDVPSGYMDYWTDGYTKDATLNLFKYLVKAVDGNEKAYNRLLVDLGVETPNLTIVQVQ